MATLYLTAIQPNPPGRDDLNEEWVEFEAVGGTRNLINDVVTQLTFTDRCEVTGEVELIRFNAGQLNEGQRVRLHTGSGTATWRGNTYHMYLGRSWFVWNNRCGDRATIRYDKSVVDRAGYGPSPREGVLYRVAGANTFA